MANGNDSGFVVLFIILTLVFLFNSGIILPDFTVFKGANIIVCSFARPGVWGCGSVGLGGVGSAGNRIDFRIREPSRQDDFQKLRFQTATDVSSELQAFLSSHNPSSFDSPQTNSHGLYQPYDPENNWDTRVPGIRVHQLFDAFGWNIDFSVSDNILQKEFVIMEGTLTPQDGSSPPRQVKTWGLCEERRDCFVWNVPGAGTNDILIVDSFEIFFKDGGYELIDACPIFNLDCPAQFETETDAVIPEDVKEEIEKSTGQEFLEEVPIEEIIEEKIIEQNVTEEETIPSIIVDILDSGEEDVPGEEEEEIEETFFQRFGIPTVLGIFLLLIILVIFLDRRN